MCSALVTGNRRAPIKQHACIRGTPCPPESEAAEGGTGRARRALPSVPLWCQSPFKTQIIPTAVSGFFTSLRSSGAPGEAAVPFFFPLFHRCPRDPSQRIRKSVHEARIFLTRVTLHISRHHGIRICSFAEVQQRLLRSLYQHFDRRISAGGYRQSPHDMADEIVIPGGL